MSKRIDTEARIESVRFEDQAGSIATPAAGFSSLYVRETGTAHGGLFLEKSTGEDIGPFITGTAAGGGGDETFTDTFANIPGVSNDGDLFFPSDGFSQYRDTGAAWVPWGPIFPFTEPVNGDFAWVNQGGASVDATKGGVLLAAPASAGDNFRIRKKAASGTPYTIDIAFLINFSATNFISCGFVWRQSSDGKIVNVGLQYSGGWHFLAQKWTNPTTFSANYFTGNLPFMYAPMLFLRCEDDGSNRKIYYCADNQSWQLINTVGRTDFLTADEVGFYCAVTHASLSGSMLLLNWVEG